jgi:hypothetical protein
MTNRVATGIRIQACQDEISINIKLFNVVKWDDDSFDPVWYKATMIGGTRDNLALDIFDNIIEKSKKITDTKNHSLENDIFAWREVRLFTVEQIKTHIA